MIINPSLPTGNVTFCDDVRFEQNGKVSIIGIYGRDLLLFGEPPLTLLQLWFETIYAMAPSDVEFDAALVLLKRDDDGKITELYRDEFNVPATPLDMFPTTGQKDGVQFAEMRRYARVINVTFEKPCTLMVRIFKDDDEIRLGTLRVEFKKPEETVVSAS